MKNKNENSSDYTQIQLKAFWELFVVAVCTALVVFCIVMLRDYGLGENYPLFIGIVLLFCILLLFVIFIFAKRYMKPQDMSVVQIATELKPSDKATSASIYKNVYAEDKAYIQGIQSGLSELENVTFSGVTRREDENYVYNGKDMYGNEFQMNFFFRSGQWSYTTYAESVAMLTEETAQKYKNRYEAWMKENKLLPDNAVFSVQNSNTLRWDVALEQDVSAGDKPFQNGSVMMQFDENGTLVDLSYQISWNEYVTTEDIISPREAYAQVEGGNFEQYVPFQQGDVLHIEECELT